MAQSSGRVTCPRCGANNFETVSTCWKCGAPLHGAGGASSASAASAASAFAVGQGTERAASASGPAVYWTPPVATTGDSGVATRAAIALALTFPWIGLPVGWCFMMIEDRRKQAIGRICAVWSMIALVIHLVLLFVAIPAALAMIVNALSLSSALKGQGGGTNGVPNLNIPGGISGGSQ